MKGIDFVLDPMWANTSSSLSEHVDGMRSFDLVKIVREVTGEAVTSLPDWWKKTEQSPFQQSAGPNPGIAVSGNMEVEPGIEIHV